MKFFKFLNKIVLLNFAVITLSVVSISALRAQKKPKINSNTFGAIEARHLGPARMSGRVSALDAVE